MELGIGGPLYDHSQLSSGLEHSHVAPHTGAPAACGPPGWSQTAPGPAFSSSWALQMTTLGSPTWRGGAGPLGNMLMEAK